VGSVWSATSALATNRDRLLTSTTLPGGDAIARTYTAVHAEAQVSTAATYAATVNRYLNFDAAGRITRQIYGSGIAGRAFSYDGLGRLKADSQISYQGSSNPCAEPNIVDENGNLCTYEGTWNTVPSGSVTFSYDAVGNRTDQGGDYGTGNRIRQFAGCTYVTDSLGDGNVLSRTCGSETVVFTWSAESRLTRLVVGVDTLDFRYDANGRLVRQKRSGAAAHFLLWQGANLLAEIDSVTGKVAEYSYYPGLDHPHAVITGTTPHFAHVDGIGSVIALTDSAKNVKRDYDFDAWGGLRGGTDSKPFSNADRARFKGALWLGPQVDVYYMRARWYEPKSGRFLSEDPLGVAGGSNIYGYAGSDPINNTDPTGLVCWKLWKFVEGEDGRSGWAEVLHCEDIGGGDWETVRDYLNSGAAGAGDWFYGLMESLGGAWEAGFARTCRGGFSAPQCVLVAQRLAELALSNQDLCRTLGIRATRRFQMGRFRLHTGYFGDPAERVVGLAHVEQIWRVGTLELSDELFPGGGASRGLRDAIAHEEAHFLWLGTSIWTGVFGHHEGDPIYKAGAQCAS